MNTQLSWLVLALLVSVPLHASEAFKALELSDHELAQLRGRYVLPDRIVSFGIVMTSTWENASGQVIGGEIGMHLSSGQAQPVLYATPIEKSGNGTAVNPGRGQVLGGAGLDSVHGIAQSVRVAGDANQGENHLEVRLDHNNNAQAPLPKPNGNGAQVYSNSAGTVRMSNQAGGLAIAIQAGNGQGNSTQQIGAGGMSQHSAVGGDLNNVRNQTSLAITLRELPSTLDMRSSLEQLRLLCPIR
ncbi:hypothetical protein [Pseudomonas sp. 5P_3.1_Bac2]|uniref:hypothetical protein n=1 Tax=Pseudomonas sp. 5P_3.1_Bac2 TaxID=2971617 RepID=UPI0021C66518|nr:hypothetical protein [Pseudomonas sp. 5P_3.1_Bac2]MCU1718556.1 hypothetical protein [Pseudomonas sp. 5P_3.1_Bac2]